MFDTDGRPLHVTWRYDRAELIADGVVHVLGITLATVGAVAILVLAAQHASSGVLGAVAIYAMGLVGLLVVSAAYNMWPISRTKWWLRRIDHAFIFILIAATYTPFVTRFEPSLQSQAMLIGVWSVAIIGAIAKVALPGRFDRLAIAIYVLLGFSGFLFWETIAAALPTTTLALIVAGGLTYTAGIVFHVWQGLRYQNAVWHGFVLAAAACHYAAVLREVAAA